ncbi:MAG TPA: hypothetical protein VK395_32795 [Gemmataceae bacterium]|nr:hypothetical protein [Gemmataceae bacterium]
MTVIPRFLPSMLLAALVAGPVCAADEPPAHKPDEKALRAPALKDKVPLVEKENKCILCHGEKDLWEGERRRLYVSDKDLAGDIHWQKGLRCYDCHGGDSTTTDISKVHSEKAKFLTLKSRKNIPELCGRCHSDINYMRQYQPSMRTDQLAEYRTSGHGKRLEATGDPQVAVCTSCHGGRHHIYAVHDLESPVYPTHVSKTCATCHSDPKIMEGRQYHGRPLGHNQYEEWKQSVHGKALLEKGDRSAPSCNKCHGNHGALPPEIGSVANACGACHAKVAGLFANTQMKHKFEEVGLPGCATCHSNHLIRQPSDEMLGMGEDATCSKCHAQGQHGATLAGAHVARTLRAELDDLSQLIAEAETKTAEAERLGMEVSGPRFDLRKAVDARVNARTLIHSFDPGPVGRALAEGKQAASEVKERAEGAMHEYTARRVWLAVSLVPIAVVVLLLLVYIWRLPIPAATTANAPGDPTPEGRPPDNMERGTI